MGLQGEGIYVGERELFIRFCGCNLSCPYCDTKYALVKASTCSVEEEAGTRKFYMVSNPIDADELVGLISPLLKNKKIYHSVVLTGGEPLLWCDFLVSFLKRLKEMNLPVTLETNGILPVELGKIIDFVDIVSMDYKLPSTLDGSDYSDKHLLFLEVAKAREVIIKFVITSNVSFSELKNALMLVRKIGDFPIVLQPVAPIENVEAPDELALLRMQEIGKELFSSVRVIPQMHKIGGWK